MQVNLYVRRGTPAHHPNPPLIAKRGDDWLLVRSHRISAMPTPSPQGLVPVNVAAHPDIVRRVEQYGR